MSDIDPYAKRRRLNRKMKEALALYQEFKKHPLLHTLIFPCRVCGKDRPFKEVASRFKVWGHWRVRFRMCRDCRKEAQRKYRERVKEKNP